MAENGVALAQARQQIHALRGAVRRADRALAEALKGTVVGCIAVDAPDFDEETAESVLSLVEAACEVHPGARIEITVVAHPGADERSRK